jgi:hypothetical protein
MNRMKKISSKLAISLAAVALTAAVLATGAQAALKHFDGTVLSKNAATKTFQIRTEGGSKVRLKVNGTTVFERIAGGFGGLTKGLSIEVDAVQTKAGLLAKQVEPQGGNGGGGDDDSGGHGGGGDDGPNHT